jgi:ABC-type transporter MlaC component
MAPVLGYTEEQFNKYAEEFQKQCEEVHQKELNDFEGQYNEELAKREKHHHNELNVLKQKHAQELESRLAETKVSSHGAARCVVG